jgi:hypothetical protein
LEEIEQEMKRIRANAEEELRQKDEKLKSLVFSNEK